MSAHLIDVGSGATTLLGALLDDGYQHLTALDISDAALAISKQQLGERAALIQWIAADIRRADLAPAAYDLWHDRAVFHFLTEAVDRAAYVGTLRRAVKRGGQVIIATFAEDGPEQCSGLKVMRYSGESMAAALGAGFTLVEQVREDHHTPWDSVQRFIHCRYIVA
jgi:SAM-dependent methyltransferase